MGITIPIIFTYSGVGIYSSAVYSKLWTNIMVHLETPGNGIPSTKRMNEFLKKYRGHANIAKHVIVFDDEEGRAECLLSWG